jgi:hypothetical protein
VPPERRKQFFTFATVVAVINSVVGGSAIAIALGAIADTSLGVAAGLGGVAALVSLVALVRYADPAARGAHGRHRVDLPFVAVASDNCSADPTRGAAKVVGIALGPKEPASQLIVLALDDLRSYGGNALTPRALRAKQESAGGWSGPRSSSTRQSRGPFQTLAFPVNRGPACGRSRCGRSGRPRGRRRCVRANSSSRSPCRAVGDRVPGDVLPSHALLQAPDLCLVGARRVDERRVARVHVGGVGDLVGAEGAVHAGPLRVRAAREASALALGRLDRDLAGVEHLGDLRLDRAGAVGQLGKRGRGAGHGGRRRAGRGDPAARAAARPHDERGPGGQVTHIPSRSTASGDRQPLRRRTLPQCEWASSGIRSGDSPSAGSAARPVVYTP